MRPLIVEPLELFSEAELESLEFLPEELEAIEAERVPDLDSISFEDIAEELEASLETIGIGSVFKAARAVTRFFGRASSSTAGSIAGSRRSSVTTIASYHTAPLAANSRSPSPSRTPISSTIRVAEIQAAGAVKAAVQAAKIQAAGAKSSAEIQKAGAKSSAKITRKGAVIISGIGAITVLGAAGIAGGVAISNKKNQSSSQQKT